MAASKARKKKKTATKKAPTRSAAVQVTPKTHWTVHPIALLFPPKPPEERAEMKADMTKRAAAGLDPLENAILKYEDKILDGRTRDELWVELAEENALGGHFKKHMPRTETFSPEKDGTLGAWMRAKSRNLIVRNTPADQRATIFLKAVEAYPELKAVLDQIKAENIKRQKEGKPLAAGGQRGNTAKQIAEMAGVGTTTVKQAQQLKKEDPEQFEQVVKGKTTTKRALKEVKDKKRQQAAKEKKGLEVSPGDLVYKLDIYQPTVKNSPRIIELEVHSVDKECYVCTGSKRVHKTDAFSLEGAKAERRKRIETTITDVEEELRNLKAALKKEPTIVAAKKAGSQKE